MCVVWGAFSFRYILNVVGGGGGGQAKAVISIYVCDFDEFVHSLDANERDSLGAETSADICIDDKLISAPQKTKVSRRPNDSLASCDQNRLRR